MDYKVKIKNIDDSTILKKVPEDSQIFILNEIIKNFPTDKFCDVVYIAKNDAEMQFAEKQFLAFNEKIEQDKKGQNSSKEILQNNLKDDKKFTLLNFFAWDSLPYDRASPKQIILANRIKTLHLLASRKENERFFIITSINSIIQKTVPIEDLKLSGLFLSVGSKISLTQIAEFLIAKGYRRQICANNVNEFAVRGGIIDIVIQTSMELLGYRIDFFGDIVESIKIFDPITQLTNEEVKFIEILPASEVVLNPQNIEIFRKKYRSQFSASLDDPLYQAVSEMRSYAGMENWLPMFFNNDLVCLLDHTNKPLIFFNQIILTLVQERNQLIDQYYQARIDDLKIKESAKYYPLNYHQLYLTADQLKEKIFKHTNIQFSQLDVEDNNARIVDLDFKPMPDFALAARTNQKDPLNLVKEFIDKLREKNKNYKILLAALNEGFADRISKILPDYDLNLLITILPQNFGFYNSDLAIIGEQAIFGERIIRKKNNKTASQRILEEGLSIQIDELVVHRDYGIGRFKGIQTITTNANNLLKTSSPLRVDMIKIEYGGGDNLFVAVDDINLITRYGADNELIQLDRLGVSAWKNRQQKVRQRIKVAATQLVEIAAKRALKKAEIFIPETHFYDEFKARFGFVETEDQAKAIAEVEDDLAKGMPMDRLICGDVGFGKTEVALRAAAIVVSNKNTIENIENSDEKNIEKAKEIKTPQVAIIAPTTLLVRQHFKNFIKRFAGTEIKIAALSRLISLAKAKEIKEKVASGEIDIVVGTHALLQKNIKFNNLSLVIIDEEQHFGVAQKERLKELRNEVHMLNLSATPIPRTLQMSMTGVKDLSLISTPPIDRLAVRNFVMPYDAIIVREAVMREYNRSGKVFFVVPRIRDIEEIEPKLKVLLPELKITHAHGKMTPSELDNIMNDFVDGKIDVLLSTTIIESGIDISDANTMIIYKAEMFGLSQLYQLRGRVGRSKVRAYCYMMTDNRKKISKDSEKKLEVMQNLDALGAGFSIASHDMDIRGSGNILGDEQSGHIKETGVELYQQMLMETIHNLKNNIEITSQNLSDDFERRTEIKLSISLLIPEEYISDLSLRMSFYKKIASIKNADDKENLINEMNDRFGKIPNEILNLIEVSQIKHHCQKLQIEKLENNADGIVASFKNNKFSNPEELLKILFDEKSQFKIHQNQKIIYRCKNYSDQDKIQNIKNMLSQLEKIAKNDH
jgi:transcription-repair coupling factor (superfamily II helicase)